MPASTLSVFHGRGRSPSPAVDWQSRHAPRRARARARPPCSAGRLDDDFVRLLQLGPGPSSAVRVMSCRSRLFSQITTSKVRGVSMPITLRMRLPVGVKDGSGGRKFTDGIARNAAADERADLRPRHPDSTIALSIFGPPLSLLDLRMWCPRRRLAKPHRLSACSLCAPEASSDRYRTHPPE